MQTDKPKTKHDKLPVELQRGNLTVETNNSDHLYVDGTKHQFLREGKQLQNKKVVPDQTDPEIQLSDLHMESRRSDPLFTHVPTITDIKQGHLGDCYLLTALSSIVSTAPQTIQDMMKDNGDGTITIAFYKPVETETTATVDGQPATTTTTTRKRQYVTVTKDVPKLKGGADAFAKDILWVQLFEKAYAVSGIQPQKQKEDGDNTDTVVLKENQVDYEHISGGRPEMVVSAITGQETSAIMNFKSDKLANAKTSSATVYGSLYAAMQAITQVTKVPETKEEQEAVQAIKNSDGTVTARANDANDTSGVFLMELNDFVLKMNDVYTT